jgi:hypothetical protein
MQPFGGRFRAHRAALAAIKSRSWSRASAHAADVSLPHSRAIMTCSASCRVCSHRWAATIPDGDPYRNLPCPRCGSPSGELAGPEYDGPDHGPGSMVE